MKDKQTACKTLGTNCYRSGWGGAGFWPHGPGIQFDPYPRSVETAGTIEHPLLGTHKVSSSEPRDTVSKERPDQPAMAADMTKKQ